MTGEKHEKGLEAAIKAVVDLMLNPDGGEEPLAGHIAEAAISAYLASVSAAPEWLPIESAPKDAVWSWGAGGRVGRPVYVLMQFTAGPRWDIGWWSPDEGCWRWLGDDGGNDMQPSHWRPIDDPDMSSAPRERHPMYVVNKWRKSHPHAPLLHAPPLPEEIEALSAAPPPPGTETKP